MDDNDIDLALPEVPADWTPGEAGEEIQVFIDCFLDRLERRSPMWRRMVEAELAGAVHDYLNITGDPPDPAA